MRESINVSIVNRELSLKDRNCIKTTLNDRHLQIY